MADDRVFSANELAQYRNPPAEVPAVANGMVRLLFGEMVRRQISYETMNRKSGVSFWTLRKWRRGVEPSEDKLAAALVVVGYEIRKTAVPIAKAE